MISPLRGTILLGVVLSAACATHKPHPFDAEAHRASLLARQVDSPDVVEFARKLVESNPQAAAFNPSDGVSIEEAAVIGLCLNGGLRSARAKLAIADAGAAHAGLWADPSLTLNLQRILESSTAPWVAAADAALSIPLWGTPGLEKQIARQRLRADAWRTVGAERAFARELRREWIEWSALEMKREAVVEQLAAVDKIHAAAQTLADANEIPRTEARLFAIERAGLSGEERHLMHEAEQRAMRIKIMIGMRPGAELELMPAIQPVPLPSPAEDEAETKLMLAEHPALQALRAEAEQADTVLHRERRAALPSLEARPGVESDEGRAKIGGGATIGLPLWNRNQRAIAEAEASAEAARIALESEVERLTGELEIARHALNAAQADWRALEDEVAPLVEEQVREARALAELGEPQALLLLEAIKKLHETKSRMIDARADLARAAVEVRNIAPDPSIPTAIKEFIDHAE